MATLSVLQIEQAALELPLGERTTLIDRLIASLKVDELSEIENAWLDEAIKRFKAYLEGKIQARPVDLVFKDAFARLGQAA